MPLVKFTSHLNRFFPNIREVEVEGGTVASVVAALNEKFPGLSGYIVDEQGKLRQHVNIFIGEDLIRDRENLGDEVNSEDQIYILQALSGGN